ncbi:hypothetical protein [Ferruginibacter albus]|uniref:hypothetical protein n=1 Tax=Ferruginibacter albus TaxID=2875540 RepID=UPI001CC5FC8D|nr:hypothetical protein [Ferruginibacter albus]UAY51086.1 hypothetical protein K9M53_10845 [Ferruginibacter albus]
MPTKNQQGPKQRQSSPKSSQGTHPTRTEKSNQSKSTQSSKVGGRSTKHSSDMRDDNMDNNMDNE